jgi:hypothetical protein
MHSANSDPPDVSDVERWSNQYSVDNHPVLADANGDSYRLINDGYPSYVLIDQNMIIHNSDLYPFNASSIASLISE